MTLFVADTEKQNVYGISTNGYAIYEYIMNMLFG